MRCPVWIAPLLAALLSASSFAADFTYSGYYRARGKHFNGLNLRNDDTRSYIDQRYRINPNLFINEDIVIRSQIDVLDGVFGGDPVPLQTSTNPNYFSYDAGLDATSPSADSKTANSFFDQGQGNRYNFLRIRRVWVEIFAGLGTFKIGRQASHFGLGLYENSGNQMDDNFGDSVDRASFATDLGSISAELGYDKDAEIDPQYQLEVPSKVYGLDSNGEDVSRFFLRSGYKTDDYSLETFISRKNRFGYNPDLIVWAWDLYGFYKMGIFKAETEFLTLQGSGGTERMDVSTYNLVSRLTTSFSKYTNLLEFGLSSGTKDTASRDKALHTMPFDKDFNISRVLFEEVIPGGSGSDVNNATRSGSAPIAGGAVSNAVYGRLYHEVRPVPTFNIHNTVLMAWAQQDPLVGLRGTTPIYTSGSKFYGFEYSLGFLHDISTFVHYGMDLVHFVPMDVYDQQRRLLMKEPKDSRSVYSAQSFLYVTF